MNAIISPLNFTGFIAFFLPGFVAFFSLSYISPSIHATFDAALRQESQVGAVFLIFFGSAAAGITISAFRGLVLDPVHFYTGLERQPLDYSKLKDPSVRDAFTAAVENTYRFAQAYGNMAVSFFCLLFLKYGPGGTDFRTGYLLFLIILGVVVVLGIYHRNYLKISYQVLNNILDEKE
jgi:hypothetical protein